MRSIMSTCINLGRIKEGSAGWQLDISSIHSAERQRVEEIMDLLRPTGNELVTVKIFRQKIDNGFMCSVVLAENNTTRVIMRVQSHETRQQRAVKIKIVDFVRKHFCIHLLWVPSEHNTCALSR